MSIPKITPEDLSSFRNFENKILSLDSKRIKYKTDDEMESQIKLSVLSENFGLEETENLMKNIGINAQDLCNQKTFILIYNTLKSKQ